MKILLTLLSTTLFMITLTAQAAPDKGYTPGLHPALQSHFETAELASLSPVYDEEVQAYLASLQENATPTEANGLYATWTINSFNHLWSELRNSHDYRSQYFFVSTDASRLERHYAKLVAALSDQVHTFFIASPPKNITVSWVIQLHQLYLSVLEQKQAWGEREVDINVIAGSGTQAMSCSETYCNAIIYFEPAQDTEQIGTVLSDYIAFRREYNCIPDAGSPWDRIRQNFVLIQVVPEQLSFYQQNKVYSVNPEQNFVFYDIGSGSPLRKERIPTSIATKTRLNIVFQSAL